jgi:hypothetical protein
MMVECLQFEMNYLKLLLEKQANLVSKKWAVLRMVRLALLGLRIRLVGKRVYHLTQDLKDLPAQLKGC